MVIACGCSCGRGSGYFGGSGYGLNGGWPMPFGPMGQAQALPTPTPGYVSSQPPSSVALPAGGVGFAAETSPASPPNDPHSVPGSHS
jgi:hypothetical protein